MRDEERTAYVEAYDKRRAERCQTFGAVFLPLEKLTDKTSGEVHLSVSLSGAPAYITRQASMVRVVKVKMKFLVLPTTVSKVFTAGDFRSAFADVLEDKIVDGEDFWFVPAEKDKAFKAKVAALPLDNSFRDTYVHEYLTRF